MPEYMPLVAVPDLTRDAKLGPMMTRLNDRQRRFVWAMVQTGQAEYKACAKAAGYTGDDNTLRVTAHRLAHDEDIQAAIQEEARRILGSAQLVATTHLVNIAANPAHKDQLGAIKEVLNRAGLNAVTEHRVTVTHNVDRTQAIREIAQIASTSGLDAQKLLEGFGITIDAEFTEVDTLPPELAGLEDCI